MKYYMEEWKGKSTNPGNFLIIFKIEIQFTYIIFTFSSAEFNGFLYTDEVIQPTPPSNSRTHSSIQKEISYH